MLKTPFKMPHESEQVLSLYFIPCFLQKRCFHVGEILLCPSPGVETKHCVCQKRCTQAYVWLSFPNAELRGAGETRRLYQCSRVSVCLCFCRPRLKNTCLIEGCTLRITGIQIQLKRLEAALPMQTMLDPLRREMQSKFRRLF